MSVTTLARKTGNRFTDIYDAGVLAVSDIYELNITGATIVDAGNGRANITVSAGAMGAITGETGDATQVAFFNAATTLDGAPEMTWDDTTKVLYLTGASVGSLYAPASRHLVLGAGNVQGIRITAVQDVVIGGIADVSFPGNDIVEARRDQNTQTIFRLRNANAGASAETMYALNTDTVSSTWRVSSSGFTLTGSRLANEAMIEGSGGASLLLRTVGAQSIRIATLDTLRATYLSTGEMIVGSGVAVLVSDDQVSISRSSAGGNGLTARNENSGSYAILRTLNNGANQLYIRVYGTAAGGNSTICELSATGAELKILQILASPITFHTSSTERARYLSTGEYIWGGTVLDASEVFSIHRNENSALHVRMVNPAQGTLGSAEYTVRVDTGGTQITGGVGGFNTIFTTATGIVADTVAVWSLGAAALDIVTRDAASIRIKPNGVVTFEANTTGVAFFAGTPVAQAAAKTNLTDSTGGAVDGTLVDVGVIFSQANINNNFADIADRLNHVLNVIRNVRLMAG